MIRTGLVLATAAVAFAATPAFADTDCTKEAKDKWMAEDAMKAKITELGYKFDLFKVDGSCYEIYGYNKDGKQVEVYFNPVTAEVVKEEIEDGKKDSDDGKSKDGDKY